MDIRISEIREAINEAWMDFKNDMGRSTSKPYEAKDQWEDEIKIFMNGLKSGDFIEFGEKSIGVEWRQGSNSNDPRFIVFEFGDSRLRDDHFSMQHSRRLTDDELKDIRDVMVRMGMVDKYEFDMEYNLNMEQFYESRVDRAIRKVISEAMYKKVPEDGNFPASKGRRPKSTEARISQLKHAANEHGLSKRTYTDGKCKAVQYYANLFKSKGYDVDWTSKDEDEQTKKYNFVLSADDGMKLDGYIKCRASGSGENPFSEYDTIMVIEPKEKRRYDESLSRLVKENVGRLLREWDQDEPDEDWGDDRYSPHEFVGLYDLSTDDVYSYDEDQDDIDVANDPFNGKHKYVHFTAYPRFNVDEDPGDYWTPGGIDVDIYDYDISVDNFTYTTVVNNGYAYYEDDESTKEPFSGLTDEQMEKVKDYLDGLSTDDWGFFD